METGFSFPGGCVRVNKNEQWKTKAALCSSLCRERGGGRSAQRERERGYNGQDSKGFKGGEITGDERENVRRERERERERERRRVGAVKSVRCSAELK